MTDSGIHGKPGSNCHSPLCRNSLKQEGCDGVTDRLQEMFRLVKKAPRFAVARSKFAIS
jgi:hypothetical protein